jgi:hypothetical protein
MQKLKISSNRRFLAYEDGSPFYWFGDTAWEVFHRSTRDDAERYLEKRNSILICAKTGTSIQRRPGRGFLLITERRRSNRFSTVNPYMKITRSVLDQSIMDTLTRMISDAFCIGTFSLAPSVIIRFGKCMNPAAGKGLTFQWPSRDGSSWSLRCNGPRHQEPRRWSYREMF